MNEGGNASEDRLLTVGELMEKTGFSRQTIYNKVSAGEIPAHKLGTQLRFRLSEINAWLDGALEPVRKQERE